MRMPIGIDYGSDVRKALKLAADVASNVSRVLKSPQPVCQLKAFGDNSIDLELRVWLNDPQNGLGNMRSEILLGVWDSFNKNGIAFPFPQRDIHLRSLPPEVMAAMGVEIVEEEMPDPADGGAQEGIGVAPHRDPE